MQLCSMKLKWYKLTPNSVFSKLSTRIILASTCPIGARNQGCIMYHQLLQIARLLIIAKVTYDGNVLIKRVRRSKLSAEFIQKESGPQALVNNAQSVPVTITYCSSKYINQQLHVTKHFLLVSSLRRPCVYLVVTPQFRQPNKGSCCKS